MADEDDEVRQSTEKGREKGEKREFGVKVVYLDSIISDVSTFRFWTL